VSARLTFSCRSIRAPRSAFRYGGHVHARAQFIEWGNSALQAYPFGWPAGSNHTGADVVSKNDCVLVEVSTAELDCIEGGQPTTGEIVKGAIGVGLATLMWGPIGGAVALGVVGAAMYQNG
jgi:hypothetical protein